MADSPSFDDLLQQLRGDANAAAAEIFRRFAHRLVALARPRLEGSLRRKVDPEDVLQSVMRSFFCRQEELELKNWDSLWAYLVVLTVRKCGRKLRYYTQQVRDIRREEGLAPPDPQSDSDWNELAGAEPTPEEAVVVSELIDQMMGGLDERGRQILELRLQGHEVAAIAVQLQCNERMVYRVLKLARRRLDRLGAEAAG